MLFILQNGKMVGLTEVRQAALKAKQPFDHLREVEGIRALDRYTLQIKLAKPDPRLI
jgi:MarR-like DNA-binding transcriptional regulator SgrR of sgrS sRNA